MGNMLFSSSEGKADDPSQSKIQKVAGPPPPPKCSTEQACLLEAQDVDGLEQMKKLDEELDTKLPLSTNMFDEFWDNIKENKQFLDVADAPTFLEERAKVIIAFQGGDFVKKQEAVDEFKKSVDNYLEKLARKNSKEDEQSDVKQTKASLSKK